MGYVVAFMGGTFVGIWVMALMNAAHDADERLERMVKDEKTSGELDT